MSPVIPPGCALLTFSTRSWTVGFLNPALTCVQIRHTGSIRGRRYLNRRWRKLEKSKDTWKKSPGRQNGALPMDQVRPTDRITLGEPESVGSSLWGQVAGRSWTKEKLELQWQRQASRQERWWGEAESKDQRVLGGSSKEGTCLILPGLRA